MDGLSGGAQVCHFLRRIGGECFAFVPDRFADGYGLNENIVKEAAAKGSGLLICIDYGTTNLKELSLARSLGLRTIVIDHHHIEEDEFPSDVFINPEREDCGFADKVLSAAGLAWFLLIGLRKAISQAADIDVREYLDLACLGTICDMVPLLGVNRIIAGKGLEVLKSTKREGLRALKEVSGLNSRISCHDVSFALGPRINAAGRMIHGLMVLELLCTSDSLTAKKIASDLNKMNFERQDVETIMKNDALRMLEEKELLPPGIVIARKDFHTGVVGIVAQRLTEMYYRPAVVLGMDEDGIYKGSMRGIKGLNVVETLAATKGTLLKFGGHEGAGGLCVEEQKIGQFTEAFEKECAKRLKGLRLLPVVQADTEIRLKDMSVHLIDELNSFSPFGMGNPTPVLFIPNLEVVDVQDIKNTHLKAILSDGKLFIAAMFWRQKAHPALYKGAKVNIAAKPDKSTYRGITELQLTLQAVEEVV